MITMLILVLLQKYPYAYFPFSNKFWKILIYIDIFSKNIDMENSPILTSLLLPRTEICRFLRKHKGNWVCWVSCVRLAQTVWFAYGSHVFTGLYVSLCQFFFFFNSSKFILIGQWHALKYLKILTFLWIPETFIQTFPWGVGVKLKWARLE